MICKLVEIRDAATFIPALAIKVDAISAAEGYLLMRAGFGSDFRRHVILCEINGGSGRAKCDPHDWGAYHGSRTMRIAHDWLLRHFDDLESGAVIDVQYLFGERPQPKRSERETWPQVHKSD